ncbi:hypothetical protein NBRC10512_003863 [Rhodotorula toruloides]|uniref:RHTO0S01e05204g1_1 n=2 Tax=Rhodotorula toruloides TaxID=5286 RepID=A0A061AEY0_RHOTO|nr:uncharacterized protein RHTO_01456 [Rhodotorula toruloides NP11]EMS21809.1 hypothetical protein RHTO_01456 [Rhodotorula toruloides NP11]CDR35701.1 RHTO0S01e05204g1_1 [Rhodotorula toruloides]
MPSPTNARAATAPGAGGDVDDEAARRAAALLDASPGIYTLRKRKRMSMDEQDDGPDGEAVEPVAEKKQVEQKGKKGVGKKGGKAPAKSKAPVAKKARAGLFARDEQAPPAGAAAKAEVEDPADNSSLTSLSDLDEREPAATSSPAPLHSSPKPTERKFVTVETEEEDELEQDEPDEPSEDDEFDPFKPAPAATKSKIFGGRKPKVPAAKSKVNGKAKGKRPPAKQKAPTKPAAARLPLQTQAPPTMSNRSRSRPPARTQSSKDLPRVATDFRPPSMPSVMELYERREEVLQHARLEATRDAQLQIRSEDLIATALESLETGSQQTALSLAMNRYSSFCAHPAVDIPPFPITPTKISLFLSRVPTGTLPLLLLSVFPQPDVYPIPVAGVLDPNLTPDESTRVTQELVRCWVDAFSFAQMATRDIWEPVLDRDRFEARAREDSPPSQPRGTLHPSLRPIKDDFIVREIIAAVESYEHMNSYAERMEAQRAAATVASSAGEAGGGVEPAAVMGGGKGKTKWTKGGKAVAAPSKSNTPTTPLSQRDGAGTPFDFPLHGAAAPAQHKSPPLGTAFVDSNDWNGADLSYYPQLEAQLSYAVHDGSTSYDRPPVAAAANDSLFPVKELRDVASHAEQAVHRRMVSSYASLEPGHPVTGPSTGFPTSSSVQSDAYSSQTPYSTGASAFTRNRHVSHDPRLQTVQHDPPRHLPAMQPAFTSRAPHSHRFSRAVAQGTHALPFAGAGSSSTTAAPASWHPSQAATGRRDSAIDLLGEAASLVEGRRDQQPFTAPFDAQTDSVHAFSTTPSMQRAVFQPSSWAQSTSHDPVQRLSAGYLVDPSPASHRPKLQHQPASYPLAHRSTPYANSQLPLIDEVGAGPSRPAHLPPTPYSTVPGYEFDIPSNGAQGYTTQQYRQSSVSQWRSTESQVTSYSSSQAYPTPAPPSTGHFSTSNAAYEGFDERYNFGATQAPRPSDSTAPASIGLGIQLD